MFLSFFLGKEACFERIVQRFGRKGTYLVIGEMLVRLSRYVANLFLVFKTFFILSQGMAVKKKWQLKASSSHSGGSVATRIWQLCTWL